MQLLGLGSRPKCSLYNLSQILPILYSDYNTDFSPCIECTHHKDAEWYFEYFFFFLTLSAIITPMNIFYNFYINY